MFEFWFVVIDRIKWQKVYTATTQITMSKKSLKKLHNRVLPLNFDIILLHKITDFTSSIASNLNFTNTKEKLS